MYWKDFKGEASASKFAYIVNSPWFQNPYLRDHMAYKMCRLLWLFTRIMGLNHLIHDKSLNMNLAVVAKYDLALYPNPWSSQGLLLLPVDSYFKPPSCNVTLFLPSPHVIIIPILENSSESSWCATEFEFSQWELISLFLPSCIRLLKAAHAIPGSQCSLVLRWK